VPFGAAQVVSNGHTVPLEQFGEEFAVGDQVEKGVPGVVDALLDAICEVGVGAFPLLVLVAVVPLPGQRPR
jgi:hypothetical protein